MLNAFVLLVWQVQGDKLISPSVHKDAFVAIDERDFGITRSCTTYCSN